MKVCVAQAWLRGLYVLLTTYYTSWSNAAFLIYQSGYLHPSLGTSVKLMLMTSSVGGAYITYIFPRAIHVKDVFPVDIALRGWMLQVGDCVSHHLPLIIMLVSENQDQDHPEGSRLPYLLVLTIYLMGHDPRTIYHLSTRDATTIFCVVAVFYFLC